jgi:hypothetical protein
MNLPPSKTAKPKVHIELTLAADVVESLKASGRNYNARAEKALRKAGFGAAPERAVVDMRGGRALLTYLKLIVEPTVVHSQPDLSSARIFGLCRSVPFDGSGVLSAPGFYRRRGVAKKFKGICADRDWRSRLQTRKKLEKQAAGEYNPNQRCALRHGFQHPHAQ